MKQVMNYNKDNGLLNMIRRTDPMIVENKYVGKIYDALPKTERKKFVQNMRRKGVADARIDQAKGLDVGGDVKYEKGKGIDGHHSDKVSENPDKMTDPRKIEFMKQEDHIKYHQQYGY